MSNRRPPSQRVLPPALQPGDLVVVIAPGGRVAPEKLEVGVESLRKRGLRVNAGLHVLDSYGHLAGQDRDRADDLMTAFADPKVKGVFCAHGGAGCSRVVPYLDLETIAANPKVFVGYSDVTTLHFVLARHAGWPTFYGPMPGSDLKCYDADCCFGALWQLISEPNFVGPLAVPDFANPASTLVPGIAEGVLAGGTLCVLLSAMGTDYALDARDKILLLEDMNEPAWRVDRMLTQLSHTGILRDAAGFVIGRLSDLEVAGELAEDECLADHIVPLRKPAIRGYPFGHIDYPATFPLGCLARLDANARSVELLEPAVARRR